MIPPKDRKEQLAHRLAALAELHGKTITSIEVSDGTWLEIACRPGYLLTIGTNDLCTGQRAIIADLVLSRLVGAEFRDLTLRYIAGEYTPTERIDLVRLALTTSAGQSVVDLMNRHTLKGCTRWKIQWRLSRSGSNHEGEWL
jgi:hypothetical protein